MTVTEPFSVNKIANSFVWRRSLSGLESLLKIGPFIILPMTSLVGMVATGGRVLDDRNGFEPPEFEKLGSVGPETIFISN